MIYFISKRLAHFPKNEKYDEFGKIYAREGNWISFGILILLVDFREDDRIVYIIFMKEGQNVQTMEKEASGYEKTIWFFLSIMIYIPQPLASHQEMKQVASATFERYKFNYASSVH
ncbi:hypothetical protein RHMOL_Rhmol07G0235300 [Rhododendron molle]|uniref:Uncharacterized protein n=1 Tax=Rhododendron molle TaxID=49168 RepID=A0ACC0N4Z7_RHOML|nr:hypothetical protein RHMOL_Rhmol07G0235300 [Rhododendron molle]